MKISTLRKIYPLLSESSKNIKWRSLTGKEIANALVEHQQICNCFNVASRHALFSSEKGREILSGRIKVQKGAKSDPAYKFRFTVEGKDEFYRVDRFDYFTRFFKIYRRYCEDKYNKGEFYPSISNNFNMAVDMAVSKMILKHPGQKGLAQRLAKSKMRCEYNRPSRAFGWLTGIKPKAVGEDGLFKRLKDYPEEAKEILNNAGEDYSYILLSGCKKVKKIACWHCLPVVEIDKDAKTVSVLNKRDNSIHRFGFDEVVDNFKAIVGIKWR